MSKADGADELQKRPVSPDKVKAHEAVDRVRRLLRAEARRHWKENPLLTGGDEAYQPVGEERETP